MFSESCLVPYLRHIEPALINHFTNPCPSGLTNDLENKKKLQNTARPTVAWKKAQYKQMKLPNSTVIHFHISYIIFNVIA